MAPPMCRVLCPALNLYPPNTHPDLFSSAVAHFQSIPWTAALLNVPGTVAFIPQCFNPLDENHDQFVGETIAGPRGLQHMLCFFTPDDATHMHDPDRPIVKVSSLYALGAGVSGWTGILHGGMTMTMVDEAMGVINEINLALHKNGDVFQSTSVTGGLQINFLKGIPINSAVCATATIEQWTGRKTKVQCTVKGGDGVELAKCSSTWVALRAKV